MTDVQIMTGQRFGRWLVVSFSHIGAKRDRFWVCVCDCGTEKPVSGYRLRAGQATMCTHCSVALMQAARKEKRKETATCTTGNP